MVFHELNVVTKSIEIEANAAQVFEAWTVPDHLKRWFTDDVSGWPGIGSTLTLTWKRFGFSVPYTIAEAKPGQRVVLKTRLPGVGTQVLTVHLARRAPVTIVTVSESGPENHKSDPMESGVDSGWQMLLGVLKNYIENHFGKDRGCYFAMLPAHFDFEQLRPLFATTEGLKQWLILDGEAPTERGQSFRFKLDGGRTMTGKVLALTHHEISLSWKEIDGYLEIKSFPTGGDNKGLCIRGATYSPDKFPPEELEAQAKDMLVQLFAALSST